MSDADGHWLAGLTDGEGCFYFKVRPKKRPNCYCFDFTFKIALRADDIPTLLQVRQILGVYGNISTSERRTGNGKPLTQWRVQKKADIARVLDFFTRFPLRSKKARDFKTWALAFSFYCRVIASQPVKHVTFARIPRPSAVKRRPLAGTAKTKLRRTPPEVITRMLAYERQLCEGRAYV